MKNYKNLPDAFFDLPADKFLLWEERAHVNDIIVGFKLPWNTEVNVVECYYAIVEKAKAERMRPDNFDWSISDGVLYCEGKSVKRVGPRDPRPAYDARADYWEGRCLDMRPSIYWE